MSRLARLRAQPRARRALLPRALATMTSVRVALWTSPFERVRRGADARSRRALATSSHSIDPADVAWAVAVAARFVPGATCLVRAFTAQRLLARGGRSSALHLGVARGDGTGTDGFEAHAWLTCDGAVVTGADGRERYTPIATFDLADGPSGAEGVAS